MIRIGFTGDFCPWQRIEELYRSYTWESAFSSVRPFFEDNDFNVVDLECPLTTAETKIRKTGPHIKAHPDTTHLLKYLHVGLAATANNHFYDYGATGIQSTHDTLSRQGIPWVGSGPDRTRASKTHIAELKGIKLAFINMCENEWSVATNNRAGCHGLDLADAYNKIQEAREQADFVLFIAHGGHEHYDLPSPRMKKWYRFLVDAGADAVIAHHTHIVSGWEVYKDAPIFYSLGNFCFDWDGMRNNSWNRGMLVRLLLEKNTKPRFERCFIEQNGERPGVFLLGEKEATTMDEHLQKRNRIIEDDAALENEFLEYADSLKPLMNTWIEPYTGKWFPVLHKKGLLPSLMGDKKKLLLTNLVRCESHRDMLLHALKKET